MKEYGFTLTQEDYEKYREKNTCVHDVKYRCDNETLADVMCSDEADFTTLPDGKKILEALIKLGE